MSDRVFVGTNLLVYAYDDSSPAKRATILTLFHRIFQSGLGVISTQVLQELAVCFLRKVGRPLSSTEIRKVITELQQEWQVFVNGPEAVLRALELEDRFQVLGFAHSASRAMLVRDDSLHRRFESWTKLQQRPGDPFKA